MMHILTPFFISNFQDTTVQVFTMNLEYVDLWLEPESWEEHYLYLRINTTSQLVEIVLNRTLNLREINPLIIVVSTSCTSSGNMGNGVMRCGAGC